MKNGKTLFHVDTMEEKHNTKTGFIENKTTVSKSTWIPSSGLKRKGRGGGIKEREERQRGNTGRVRTDERKQREVTSGRRIGRTMRRVAGIR